MRHANHCGPDRHTLERAAALNALDSRALGRASCYAQRFMRPGTYPYGVVPGYGQAVASDRPFLIEVGDAEGDAMAQHDILVTHDELGFEVDRRHITIRTGDLVLWSGNGRTLAPFAVVGEREFFNSHRMVNECGYSHAFGTAGEYRWVDAYGSGLCGTVRVRQPDTADRAGFARWHKELQEGTVVMIQDGRIDRPEVDIVVGQTVFFAIVTSRGISITDERLLEIGGSVFQEAPRAAS